MMTNFKTLPGFLSHQLVIILEEAKESRDVEQSGGQVWAAGSNTSPGLVAFKDKQP